MYAIIIVSVGMAVAGAAQEQSDSPLARLIAIPMTVNIPVGSCTVPGAVSSLARHLRVPAGVERIPGPCARPAVSPPTDVPHL